MAHPSPDSGDAGGSPAAGASRDHPHPPERRGAWHRFKHPFTLTMAGLPEMELFGSEEQRQASLGEMAREAGNVRSAGFWLAVAVLAVTVFAVGRLARMLFLRMGLAGVWAEMLQFAVMLGAYWFILRALHRWGARKDLRRKLLAARIPVCMSCGYLLRGLPLSPGRCPECGRPFDDRVRELLTAGQGGDPESPGVSA